MTLEAAAMNSWHRIVSLASADESELARLIGMGLRPGAPVTKLIRTPFRDPVECLVGHQLMAIERRLLQRIFVEPIP